MSHEGCGPTTHDYLSRLVAHPRNMEGAARDLLFFPNLMEQPSPSLVMSFHFGDELVLHLFLLVQVACYLHPRRFVLVVNLEKRLVHRLAF